AFALAHRRGFLRREHLAPLVQRHGVVERVECRQERPCEPLLRDARPVVVAAPDLGECLRLADLAPAGEEVVVPDDEPRLPAVLAAIEPDITVAGHASSVSRGRPARIGAATDGCYARPRTRQ